MAKHKSKAKQAKTFLKKGLLQDKIKARQKHRDFAAKVDARKRRRQPGRDVHGKARAAANAGSEDEDDDDDDDEEEELDAGPAAAGEEEDEGAALGADNDDDDASLGSDDDSLLAPSEDEDDDGDLGFDDDEEDDEEPGSSSKAQRTRVLTSETLQKWQSSILESRSLRTLRAMLGAFRSAVTTNIEGAEGRTHTWEIRSSSLRQKLVFMTLKSMHLVLAHHVPYTEVPKQPGRYKVKTNSQQYATAQRLLKSFFHSIQSLLASTSKESDVPLLAIREGSNLVPFIVGNRKVARAWVRMLLRLYESDASSDELKIEAFLALRKLVLASDLGLREQTLKSVYTTVLAIFKTPPTVFTLPGVNLMKNSASELFHPGSSKQEQDMMYRLCFSYIRSLALLLRKAVKDKGKESYRAVYNWQFVQAVDFWSIVLSNASSSSGESASSDVLTPLIYPLVETVLGAVRLVPISRYFPLRFHLVRALVRLVQKTGTYVPLAPLLVGVIESPEVAPVSQGRRKTHALKHSGNLKLLDLETCIRAPVPYLKTRVYSDALIQEAVYLLGEYLGVLSTQIAFPELALPISLAIKRHSKAAGGNMSPGSRAQLKTLLERLEANSQFIEQQRRTVQFAPGDRDQVAAFLDDDKDANRAPLKSWLKLLRKQREQNRAMLDRAAQADSAEQD